MPSDVWTSIVSMSDGKRHVYHGRVRWLVFADLSKTSLDWTRLSRLDRSGTGFGSGLMEECRGLSIGDLGRLEV